MPLRSGKNSKQQKKHLAAAQRHLCSTKNAFWRRREKTVRGGKKTCSRREKNRPRQEKNQQQRKSSFATQKVAATEKNTFLQREKAAALLNNSDLFVLAAQTFGASAQVIILHTLFLQVKNFWIWRDGSCSFDLRCGFRCFICVELTDAFESRIYGSSLQNCPGLQQPMQQTATEAQNPAASSESLAMDTRWILTAPLPDFKLVLSTTAMRQSSRKL